MAVLVRSPTTYTNFTLPERAFCWVGYLDVPSKGALIQANTRSCFGWFKVSYEYSPDP